MDEKIETSENAGKTVSRRTVAKGIAWGVPAITVLGATPAFASTPLGQLAFTSHPAYIFAGTFVNGVHTGGTGNVTAVQFTGTTPAVNAEQIITVKLGTATASVTIAANATTWTVSLDASGVPDGKDLAVTAFSSSEQVTSATTSITKDTVAPAPSITSVTYNMRTQTLTVVGTLGTGDSTSGTLNATIKDVSSTSTVSGTSWTQAFTSVNPKEAYSFSVAQTDGAGNSTTSAPTSGTTPAN